MKVKDLFWFLVLGGGALFAYDKYKSQQIDAEPEVSAMASTRAAAGPVGDRSWIKRREDAPATNQPASRFKCDGRTHCSQMRSCAEAEYFLRHCPNTKMDGNHDGEPCERQWCN